MIVFPVQEADACQKPAVMPQEEPNFHGYVLRSSTPYERDTDADESFPSSSDGEVEVAEDLDDLMQYLHHVSSDGAVLPPHLLADEKILDSASSHPFWAILTRMLRYHKQLFQEPSGSERVGQADAESASSTAPENQRLALQCLDTIIDLDEEHYFRSLFDFLRKQVLFGVREHEEQIFAKTHGAKPENTSQLRSSPVLAWLEDSVVRVLEHVLTTHFVTTDISIAARRLWLALPKVLHSHGIVPQRRYLRYGENDATQGAMTERSQAYSEAAHAGITDFLAAAENYDTTECGDTFHYNVRSIPGYSEMIPFPMSFAEIREHHAEGKYASLQSLFYDFELMIVNCVIYNPPDTEYYAHAKSMYGFVFTWMANQSASSVSNAGQYAIDFEEHIVNMAIFERLGEMTEALSPKAKLMRDDVASQSITYFTQFHHTSERFVFLNRNINLPETPIEVSSYLSSALEAALIQTIPMSHPTNLSTKYLFSCVELLVRYTINSEARTEDDENVELTDDVKHSAFLNIEGFHFGPLVVEQFPLVKDKYWCLHTHSALAHRDCVAKVDAMVRKALRVSPRGRMVLNFNHFFKGQKTAHD